LKPGPVTDGVFRGRERSPYAITADENDGIKNYLKILTSLISETLLSHGIPNSQWPATFHEEQP